jgi:hypothetical protein
MEHLEWLHWSASCSESDIRNCDHCGVIETSKVFTCVPPLCPRAIACVWRTADNSLAVTWELKCFSFRINILKSVFQYPKSGSTELRIQSRIVNGSLSRPKFVGGGGGGAQFPHNRKNTSSSLENRFVLFREIIAVYFENHTKHKFALSAEHRGF